MEDLRRTFLADSISRLENLKRKIQTEPFSAELSGEAFRALHTIKGTAQVLGLRAPAQTAHEMENLLAAAQNERISDEKLQTKLSEGIEILLKSLADKNFRLSPENAEKLPKYTAEKDDLHLSDEDLSFLPASLSAQMSEQEKNNLRRALKAGNNLHVLEIGFSPKNFADEFKNFRRKLSEKGEIIATFPSAKFAAQGEIGFQIVFAASENSVTLAGDHQAEIVSTLRPASAANARSVIVEILKHAENLAGSLGKKIEFESFVGIETIAPEKAKTIFEALLHLVRNAIDHGIEREGVIKIEISSAEGELRLKVSDDGRGIDIEKVRRRAIERNLIEANADLNENEILEMIFAHGFSTAEKVSDISGRGVGLDTVRDSVRKAGGSILVKSSTGEGTTFEITLKEK